MRRPYLVNFSAIVSNKKLSIKLSTALKNYHLGHSDQKITPINEIRLFKKNNFRINIIALCENNTVIFNREYDTDNYGKLNLEIPYFIHNKKIQNITLYETSTVKKYQLYLGSFLPFIINEPKKIIISDFDKTLVDTKYSTPKELYYSLNKPLDYFPTVEKSLQKVKDFIDKGYQPFILSASPHFYEKPIRDWLYQNKVYASNVFLKDYRDFISIFDGPLSTKDLTKQGFYKLNQLVDILLMVGIPNELILIGDGFESDPFIYTILKLLIHDLEDPWKLWKNIKNHHAFNLTAKQDSYFITKFYQLSEMAKKQKIEMLNIYIRENESTFKELKQSEFVLSNDYKVPNSIQYFEA